MFDGVKIENNKDCSIDINIDEEMTAKNMQVASDGMNREIPKMVRAVDRFPLNRGGPIVDKMGRTLEN